MPRYVCDFSQVNAVGDKMIEIASELKNHTNQYSTKIKDCLSGWEGQAKNTFETQRNNLEKTINDKAEYTQSFGSFLKKASQSIEKLEDELSTLNI